jgi:hypothetical protein
MCLVFEGFPIKHVLQLEVIELPSPYLQGNELSTDEATWNYIYTLWYIYLVKWGYHNLHVYTWYSLRSKI